MKIEFSKKWIQRMISLEGDFAVGAGSKALDPTSDSFYAYKTGAGKSSLALSRFVQLMRREQGITVDRLAELVDIEASELLNIEQDANYTPEPRTVYQLANYFHVNKSRLMQISGLASKKDADLIYESVRFAAKSNPMAKLTPEEREALDIFVKVLEERK
jgi:transcriptional regulator with XRE-family HTH domain